MIFNAFSRLNAEIILLEAQEGLDLSIIPTNTYG